MSDIKRQLETKGYALVTRELTEEEKKQRCSPPIMLITGGTIDVTLQVPQAGCTNIGPLEGMSADDAFECGEWP